jgi:hypothetical protein
MLKGSWGLLRRVLVGAAFTASLALPARADEAAKAKAIGNPPQAMRSPYKPDRFAGRAGKYYNLVWGIDSISVRLAESGEVVRFSYLVIDPVKAKPLGDKRNEPSLIDPRAGVSLVVPTMAKIGQLRQTGAPEAGKAYWMAFSNKGRKVKRGDRVDVVIGEFRAPGLVVD